MSRVKARGQVIALILGLTLVTSVAYGINSGDDESFNRSSAADESVYQSEPASSDGSGDRNRWTASIAGETEASIASGEETPSRIPRVVDSGSVREIRLTEYDDGELLAQKEAAEFSPCDPVMEAFTEYNPEYRKIALQATLSAGQYQRFCEQAESFEDQMRQIVTLIEAAEEQKKEYEQDGNIIGQLNAIAAIKNYESQYSRLLPEYASACLQRDMASYSAIRGENTAREQERSLQFEFYSEYSRYPMLESAVRYWEKQVDCLSAQLETEETKLNAGYSTEAVVAQMEAELAMGEAELAYADGEKGRLEQSVRLKCGGSQDVGRYQPTGLLEATAQPTELLERFREDNTAGDRYDLLISAYSRYVRYMEQQNLDAGAEAVQLELAKLDREQYGSVSLPLYIQGCIDLYGSQAVRIEALESRLEANSRLQTVMELAVSKGRNVPLDLLRLESEAAGLEMELEKNLYQSRLILFVMEYRVEGASLENMT